MSNRLISLSSELGKPQFARPQVQIHCGDCLDFLKRMPDETVDLTVTSPPYNIGKPYEHKMAVEEYLDWCELWLKEIYRVTAPQGEFWLNLGYLELPGRGKAVPIPYLLWRRLPFYVVQEIVWNYGAGVAAKKSFSPRNEKFLWCVKDADNYTFNLDAVRDKDVKYPNQKKNGKLRCNPLGKNPSDVWQFPKVTSGKDRASRERTAHPAQFPVAVIDRIVKACSNPGDLVMDPFMGSGTTAEAALLNSREVIGFEIKPEYVDIAARRIDDRLHRDSSERAQGQLFARI